MRRKTIAVEPEEPEQCVVHPKIAHSGAHFEFIREVVSHVAEYCLVTIDAVLLRKIVNIALPGHLVKGRQAIDPELNSDVVRLVLLEASDQPPEPLI